VTRNCGAGLRRRPAVNVPFQYHAAGAQPDEHDGRRGGDGGHITGGFSASKFGQNTSHRTILDGLTRGLIGG
jgi:hypothetical protein